MTLKEVYFHEKKISILFYFVIFNFTAHANGDFNLTFQVI